MRTLAKLKFYIQNVINVNVINVGKLIETNNVIKHIFGWGDSDLWS